MTIKTFISYVLLIAVTVTAGSYFAFGTKQDVIAESTLETVDTGESGAVGQDVLSLLSQIQSLSIDAKIFDNPVYASLVDYTVVIPRQNLGRPNPFAPFDKNIQPINDTTPTPAPAPKTTQPTTKPATKAPATPPPAEPDNPSEGI